MAKLEVKHLSISFRTNNGAVRAVRDVSFDLNAGETLAVAGESGSGKSVTARAVMGILAGNAMVEGGEIIYDGRDLLKIPEEEFHTLRGHRLAMVFQDPLSALNPIMRIGRQLTEAMILNNRERRADGRRRFEQMLGQLEKDIRAAKGDGAGVREEIRHFRGIVDSVAKREDAYNAAQESAVGALDCVEEIDLAMLRRDHRAVPEIARRLAKLCRSAVDPELKLDGRALVGEVERLGTRYRPGQESALREALETLKSGLEEALCAEKPDFFAGEAEFLNAFTDDVALAARHSRERADTARQRAVGTLRRALPAFTADELDRKACERAIARTAEAVRESIDPLSIEKDNLAYVYASSMKAGLERYFEGLARNPKEQKRFRSETVKYEKLTAKGKPAASVAPMHLVDVDGVRRDLLGTVERLIEHFENDDVGSGTADGARAVAIVDYLKARSREYSYRLSPSMARHRAIDLMKEVGIPEPHKRFSQYPFEFSGGMRQRIVIAIALSANPDILICDEPTTALDVTIQAQILELINRLKVQRRLSVIFITHDLGVVANMADRIAVMYAGKIVEYGTADEVFYDPRHPYTWALLASMPDLETKEKLDAIPGTPPNMIVPPKGDAFAARNRYAMAIDLEEQPPMFEITPTHRAATWLLHPSAPKVEPPAIVTERIERMRTRAEVQKGGDPA